MAYSFYYLHTAVNHKPTSNFTKKWFSKVYYILVTKIICFSFLSFLLRWSWMLERQYFSNFIESIIYFGFVFLGFWYKANFNSNLSNVHTSNPNKYLKIFPNWIDFAGFAYILLVHCLVYMKLNWSQSSIVRFSNSFTTDDNEIIQIAEKIWPILSYVKHRTPAHWWLVPNSSRILNYLVSSRQNEYNIIYNNDFSLLAASNLYTYIIKRSDSNNRTDGWYYLLIID